MKGCGALDWTKSVLDGLHDQLVAAIGRTEVSLGGKNPVLRAAVELLHV